MNELQEQARLLKKSAEREEALRAQIDTLTRERDALRDAALALYNAGRWELPETTMPAAEQAVMWERLRDALLLPLGHSLSGAAMSGAIRTMCYRDLFAFGRAVRRISGPEWDGVVVGYYSSTFTPEGLVIECTAEGARGQVHVEPAKRMERIL